MTCVLVLFRSQVFCYRQRSDRYHRIWECLPQLVHGSGIVVRLVKGGRTVMTGGRDESTAPVHQLVHRSHDAPHFGVSGLRILFSCRSARFSHNIEKMLTVDR
jgi:hypothetical protein